MIELSSVPGRRVAVSEATSGSWEGGNVWPPAFQICACLDAQEILSAEALQQAAVLECGAGCGLCGITASILGAQRVVLSDLPVAVPILRDNACANGLVINKSLEVQTLDWTETEQPLLAPPDGAFDLILASECLYDPDMVVPLLRTAHRACKPAGILVVAGIIGGETVRVFRRHLPRFFAECVALPPSGDPSGEIPPIGRAVHRITMPHPSVLPDA